MMVKILSALLILATGFEAGAAKYFAAIKDKEVFAQLHSQFTLRGDALLLSSIVLQKNGQTSEPFKNVHLTVQDSLKNLQAIVIDTQNTDQIELLKKTQVIEFVEAEIFYPAPKPLANFRPWKFTDVTIAAPLVAAGASAPTQPWGIAAVKAPQAWAIAGKGTGARVMILDTGIDFNHPALAANFEKGQDFVSSTGGSDVTDEIGHGSHVAGTVAGIEMTDGFAGVAPEAKILAGKVCSNFGCSNIGVASGINWGITEKVDVISMSLGGPIGSMAEKRACEAANLAGITVIAATGNDSRPRISYPAAFQTVIAVGAVDSHLARAQFSNYGPELAIMGPGVSVVSAVPVGSGRESKVTVTGLPGATGDVASAAFQGSPEVTTPVTNQMVPSGLGLVSDFSAAVHGRFALISRGSIAFSEKVKNAIAAGAAGVVIYNNAPGLLNGTVTPDGSIVAIPVVMIEQAVGEMLVNEITKGGIPTLTMQTILTDYAAFDGTSMATPHVSGVAALVKAAKNTLSPADVKMVLQSTAGSLGPALEYGSGIVDAAAAVTKAKSL